jgi:hypothetical protein
MALQYKEISVLYNPYISPGMELRDKIDNSLIIFSLKTGTYFGSIVKKKTTCEFHLWGIVA